jgi:hypothetical protein
VNRGEQGDMFPPPLGSDESNALGRELRDEGIVRAEAGAEHFLESWSDRAFGFAVLWIAARSTPFQSSELRLAAAAAIPAPPNLRAWGAVMGRLARAELITLVGFEPHLDPKSHRTPASVWTSRAARKLQS